ncbi:membrane bound O-acyl transferase family-domain-containing protein, partial [Mycena alexandri]
YYVTNVLAILGPETFVYRLALLPITLFTAYRASVSLDLARGFLDSHPERLGYFNQALVLTMFTVFTRTTFRTFSSQTPQRRRESPTAMTPKQIALDAVDLTFNIRGYGWNFASSMKVAPQTRPLTPTSMFLAAAAKSLLAHILIFDFFHYISQILGSDTVGSTVGGSVYDAAISNPLTRQSRATLLTILVGLLIYGAIQISHDAYCIISVAIFRQNPSDSPPLFNAPWLSTSLTDFWAARWHQVFRQDFLAIGAKPLSLVAGRPGGVLGAFLVSGMLHFVGLWGMNKGTDIRVVYFFLMMGVGVILEGFWRRVTGRRVGGWLGWIWSCVWLVGFGPLMADPWCQSGIMGSVFLPQPIRP